MRIGDAGEEHDPEENTEEPEGLPDPEDPEPNQAREYELGEFIGGYELIRVLGRGGFGTVYLGRREDGDPAAIKVLHPSVADDEQIRRRFRDEVRHNKRVKRYFIAEVIDADTETTPPWVVTEYVDGRTLRRLVDEEGPLEGDPLYRLALATGTALGAVHGANIVHRDFTPTNIIITRDGVRVIDFGIARTVKTRDARASAFIGTPRYMAPEQIEGAQVTSAIDVHAWGAVMAFAATGRHVFDADADPRVLKRIRHDEPDLSGLPDYLARIVARCLRKDPLRRPTSYQLLSALLGKEFPPDQEWRGGSRDSDTLLLEEGVRAYELTTGVSQREPFQIAGVYYADTAELANGMQHHWNVARETLQGMQDRHALRRWLPESEVQARRIVGALPKDYGGADVQAAHLIAALAPGLPAFFRDYDMSWDALFSTRAGRAWPYRGRGDEHLMELVEGHGLLKTLSEHHCIGSDHPCAADAPCVLYGRVAERAAVMFDRLRRRQAWMERVAETLAFTPREISPVGKGDLVHMLATHEKREANRAALVTWAAQGITEGRVRTRVCATVEDAADPWPAAVALRAQREDLRTVAERWARLERDEARRENPPAPLAKEDEERGQRERERWRERLQGLESGPVRLLPRGLQILGAAMVVVGLVVGVAYWGDLTVLVLVSILAGAALVLIGVALARDQVREVEELRRLSSGDGESRVAERTQEMRGATEEDDEPDEDDERDKERLKVLRGHLSDFPD